MSSRTTKTERLARGLFYFAVLLAVFSCGMAVAHYKVFPYKTIVLAAGELQSLFEGERLPGYYIRDPDADGQRVHAPEDVEDATNLVIQMGAEGALTAKIMDMRGRALHTWDLDWFRVWPNADHLSARVVPKERPGTHIHGAAVMPNGDLIYNYEHLGLVRLNRAGDVVWRLPYQTHHSIHVHDDGNLWVCGQVEHTKKSPRFPLRAPPFYEYTILEVSPQGEILDDWSVARLLRKNGYIGLLHQKPKDKDNRPDWFHLNDVEPFPDSMPEGFFKRGDIAVSLRDVSTVFVFNRETEEIRHACIGKFFKQHDPDFIDGDTYSVFDNRPDPLDKRSRIVIVSGPTGDIHVHYEGTEESPFFTAIMGKHQWLDDGHLLISESRNGRAFEIDSMGNIVWEYFNYVAPETRGMVEEVQRLPTAVARIFKER